MTVLIEYVVPFPINYVFHQYVLFLCNWASVMYVLNSGLLSDFLLSVSCLIWISGYSSTRTYWLSSCQYLHYLSYFSHYCLLLRLSVPHPGVSYHHLTSPFMCQFRFISHSFFFFRLPEDLYSSPLPLPPSATWVRRPFEDDDDLQPPEGKIYLSDFQVEKFTYYFTDVFDHNKDRVITIEDIHALNEVSRRRRVKRLLGHVGQQVESRR